MKTSKRILMGSLILSLIMAMAIMFSGCGSSPTTLEEYVNSDSEAQEMIDSMSSSGMTIDITDNTLTYTYTYNQTFDDDIISQMAPEMEKTMDSMSSTFEGVAQTLEEGSEIEGITVKVVYVDAAGTEIYSAEYQAK